MLKFTNTHTVGLFALLQISRRSLEKRYKDKVVESLHIIEENGGRVSINEHNGCSEQDTF